jgi:hypothetical protein
MGHPYSPAFRTHYIDFCIAPETRFTPFHRFRKPPSLVRNIWLLGCTYAPGEKRKGDETKRAMWEKEDEKSIAGDG